MEGGISDEFEFPIKFDGTTPIKLVCSKNVSYQPLCTLGHLKTAIQSYTKSGLNMPLFFSLKRAKQKASIRAVSRAECSKVSNPD
jgi:hypothetical protein